MTPPNFTPVQGLHHLTVMASDPQRNLDFYTQTLGQRLVKVTVNFDDPGTYHFYYGDLTGKPGTIMTHFPWPGARKGVRGNGEVVAAAYSAPKRSLAFWRERLGELKPQESVRFGDTVLRVEDPDGTWVELVFDSEDEAFPVDTWPRSPVPEGDALRGFHSVTAWVHETAAVRELLVHQLGFQELNTEKDAEGQRTRFRGSGQHVGLFVDAVERPGQPRGSFGAGSVHHVALRTRDDAEQQAYLQHLTAAGYSPTPVQDRQYFRSIYFREPNGVLFEIATDAPGFADDEAVDELGKHLKLPTWYEAQRAAIERRVPRIISREYGVTIGERELTQQVQTAPAAGLQVMTAGRPLGEGRLAAVLLHGRGSTAQDILSLERELGLSAYTYLAPQAEGGSWYPQSFLAPVEQNQPHLDNALALIDALMAELYQRGISPEQIILGGFSQGACLALEYAARRGQRADKQRLGGVLALSGALITLQHGSNLAGTPIFMGVADDDAHIPLERFQASATLLEQLGAKVDARVYPGLGHAVNKDELDAARDMMRAASGL